MGTEMGMGTLKVVPAHLYYGYAAVEHFLKDLW